MHEFLEINNNWFYEKYFTNLKKRYFTFKVALNVFLQRDGEIIVETGTQRAKDDWGGGCSTTIFGDFCKYYSKYLYTVDNNAGNLEVSRRETIAFKDFITYELSDSVEYLKRFDSKIDLLYLDSLDCKEDPADCNLEAQTHALNELKAAYDKLSPKAIVLIDDNLFVNGGKTRLGKLWLQKRGWTMLLDYKQSLWMRS
jgi:hypothetical protein